MPGGRGGDLAPAHRPPDHPERLAEPAAVEHVQENESMFGSVITWFMRIAPHKRKGPWGRVEQGRGATRTAE